MSHNMGIGFRELTAKAGDIGFRVVTSLKAGADFKKIKCQQKKRPATAGLFIFKVQTNYCFIAL